MSTWASVSSENCRSLMSIEEKMSIWVRRTIHYTAVLLTVCGNDDNNGNNNILTISTSIFFQDFTRAAFPVSCQCRTVSAVVPLDSVTPKTWVSTLYFRRYPIPLRIYYYFRSGKYQFPFPVTYQCRTVSAVAPLDSGTLKTWVSTLEFHKYLKRFQSYNYFRLSSRHIWFSYMLLLLFLFFVMYLSLANWSIYLNWPKHISVLQRYLVIPAYSFQ